MKMEQCVPKRRHVKFRRREISHKKSIQHSEHDESFKSVVPLHIFVTRRKVYSYISNRSTVDYNRYIEKVNISYKQGHLQSILFECYVQIFDRFFAHRSHVTDDAICLSYKDEWALYCHIGT
jgi:hypothetical protein